MSNQITFAVRGDNLNARYSAAGKVPVIYGTNVTQQAGGGTGNLSGGYIDFTSGTSNKNAAIYPGFGNVGTSQAKSALIRLAFSAITGSQGLFACNFADLVGTFALYYDSTGLNGFLSSELGVTIYANHSAWSPTLNQYYDVVITSTGQTGANGVKVYVDGVVLFQSALSANYPNPRVLVPSEIIIGYLTQSINLAKFKLDECVLWNYVIDPTAVALNSGTGSLNGSSRASLVSVSSFDGLAATDPGIANVRSGTGYTIAGSALTGTLDLPSVNDVRSGTAFDSTTKTGLLDLPSVNDVRLSTTFDRTTKTGLLNLPSINDVRLATTFDQATKTGNARIPPANKVVAGYLYDSSDSVTGTFTGSYTDPGVANVRSGISYTFNGTVFTGTAVVLPTIATGNWAPSDTQIALFNYLSNDATLMSLLGTTVGGTQKVFNRVPDNTAFPFIAIDVRPWVDRGNYTTNGLQGEIWVHVWYQAGASGSMTGLGDKPVQAIQARVDALLHNSYVAISGWRNLSLRRNLVNIMLDPDNITLHGIQKFKLLIGG
jgi:hypothetical protein